MGKKQMAKRTRAVDNFHCLGFLSNPEKETCTMSRSRVDVLREIGAFDEEVEIRLPKPNQRVDSVSPSWVCMYEHPFSLGLKFPFPKLITDFFRATKLAYVQLMPQGWRVLVTMMKVSEKHGIDLGLEELAYCYYLRQFGSHRYFFRTRHGRRALVLKTENSDRGWKRKFFFIEKESVEEEILMPTEWNTEVASLASLFPESDRAISRVEAVLELPEADRSFTSEPYEGKVLISGEEEEEGGSDSESKIVPDPQSPAGMSTGSQSALLGKRFSVDEINSLVKNARVKIERGLPPKPSRKDPEVIEVRDTSGEDKEAGAMPKKGIENVFQGVEFEEMGEKVTCEISKKMGEIVAQAFASLNAERVCWKDKLAFAEKEKSRLESDVELLKVKSAQMEGDLEEALQKLTEYEKAHLREIQEMKKYYQTSAAKAMVGGRIEMIKEYNQGQQDKWDLNAEYRTLKMLDEDEGEAEVEGSEKGTSAK